MFEIDSQAKRLLQSSVSGKCTCSLRSMCLYTYWPQQRFCTLLWIMNVFPQSEVASRVQMCDVWVWGDCVGRKREELTGLHFCFGGIQLQWSIQLSKVGTWMKLCELPHFLSNLCVPCAMFVFVEKKHKLRRWFKDVPGGPVPRYLDSVEGFGFILCSKLKTIMSDEKSGLGGRPTS